MKKLMDLAIYSCKRASELIDRRTVDKLSFSERTRLRLHLSMCKKCSSYAQHSEFVDLAVQRLLDTPLKNPDKKLDEKTRESIIRKIKEEQGNNM